MTPERAFFGVLGAAVAIVTTATVAVISQFLSSTEILATVILWTCVMALTLALTKDITEVA